METEIVVTDNDFNESVVEQSKKLPVVVDFWAPWCTPCIMLGPTLEKLAGEYNGKFILAKMNVDENHAVSQRYGIMSIPNVKLFRDGELVDEFIGVLPEPAVKQWLERNI
jgi:thioredoxin